MLDENPSSNAPSKNTFLLVFLISPCVAISYLLVFTLLPPGTFDARAWEDGTRIFATVWIAAIGTALWAAWKIETKGPPLWVRFWFAIVWTAAAWGATYLVGGACYVVLQAMVPGRF